MTFVGSALVAKAVRGRKDRVGEDGAEKEDTARKDQDELDEDTLRGSEAPTEDSSTRSLLREQPDKVGGRRKWRRVRKKKSRKEKLEGQCPEGTEAEYCRFHSAFGKEAAQNLEMYLEWRRVHELDNEDALLGRSDAEDWVYAAKKAISFSQRAIVEGESVEDGAEVGVLDPCPSSPLSFVEEKRRKTLLAIQGLPQILFTHELADGQLSRDQHGNLIVHALPSLIDLSLAPEEMWGLAVLIYFDRKLKRDSEEKLTLVMDVRPGMGWPNLTIGPLLGLVKNVTTSASQIFPVRLHKCIVFPVPYVATAVWRLIRVVVPGSLRKRFIFVSGKDEVDSPVPTKVLELCLCDETMIFFEQTRTDLFVA